MSEKRMLQAISLGFAIQCFALLIPIGQRDGRCDLWWECVVFGAIGVALFLLVTFVKRKAQR